MGVPADRERHGQKQKEPGTGLGKMGPQRKQGNQGDYIREASKKRDLVRLEDATQPCEKFEVPKNDHGMRQHHQHRVPNNFLIGRSPSSDSAQVFPMLP